MQIDSRSLPFSYRQVIAILIFNQTENCGSTGGVNSKPPASPRSAEEELKYKEDCKEKEKAIAEAFFAYLTVRWVHLSTG